MTKVIPLKSISDDLDIQFQQLVRTLNHSQQTEYEWDHGQLEDDLITIIEGLHLQQSVHELELLFNLCKAHPEINEVMNPYLAEVIILLKLAEQAPNEEIKPFCKPFFEDPVGTIDNLMTVFDFFVLFGNTALAEELCINVFERLAETDFLIFTPEDQLARIIFCNELQQMFIHSQSEVMNWQNLDKIVRPYGYDFKKSDYQSFEKGLLDNLDPVQMGKQFKKSFSIVFMQLQAAFCKHMWHEKKIPFITSEAISTLILNFLAGRKDRSNHSLSHFFQFDEEELEEYLVDLLNWIQPSLENALAFVWGVPHFYHFLNKINLINDETTENTIQIIITKKNEFDSQNHHFRKLYTFIENLE